MKKFFTLGLFILIGFTGVSAYAANGSSWEGGDPTLRTVGVESVSNTSATLKAFYSSEDIDYNADDSPSLYIEYGPGGNLSFTTETKYQSRGSRTELFPVKDLRPSTSYSFRAVLLYNNKIAKGDIMTFPTTSSPTIGTVDTSTNTTIQNNTITTNTTGTTSNTSTTTTSGTESYSVWGWLFGTNNKKDTTKQRISRPSSVVTDGIKLSITNGQLRTRTNDKLAYIIEYANKSKKDLKNVSIELVLPFEYAFVSSNKGQYDQTNHSVIADIRTLNKNESGVMSVIVLALGKTPNPYTEAVARIVHDEGIYTVYDTDEYVTTTVRGTTSTGNSMGSSTFIGWFVIMLIIAGLVFVSYRYFKKDK